MDYFGPSFTYYLYKFGQLRAFFTYNLYKFIQQFLWTISGLLLPAISAPECLTSWIFLSILSQRLVWSERRLCGNEEAESGSEKFIVFIVKMVDPGLFLKAESVSEKLIVFIDKMVDTGLYLKAESGSEKLIVFIDKMVDTGLYLKAESGSEKWIGFFVCVIIRFWEMQKSLSLMLELAQIAIFKSHLYSKN